MIRRGRDEKKPGRPQRSVAVRTRHRTLEWLESRTLLAGNTTATLAPWQNPLNNLDVNNDHHVTPLDALVIINQLNVSGSRALASSSSTSSIVKTSATSAITPTAFVDVNGDNMISPLDALMVLNTLNASSPAVVSIRLATLDLNNNPISTVIAGTDFKLEGFVQDLRTAPTDPGVFAAYENVAYDDTLATISPSNTITYISPYTEGTSGSVATAGSISEVGSFSGNLSPFPDTSEVPQWVVTVHATAAGSETFTGTPAQVAGHEVLVYGQNTAVPTDQVNYIPASITITSQPVNGPGVLTLNDTSVTDNATLTTNAVFTVSLLAPVVQTVTVGYATQNNTAIAGTDYTAQSGTLSFAPGITSLTVTVPVLPHATAHAPETFFLNLSNPVGGSISRAQGTATIASLNQMTIGDIGAVKTTSGLSNAVFTVSLAQPAGQTLTVQYATADGTATAPADYIAQSGTLTFSPGTSSDTITIAIVGSTVVEGDQTFVVNLSNPVGATLTRSQATGTIHDASQSSPLAQISLQVVDPTTLLPITNLNPGDDFLLEGEVLDLRPSAQGVYAAYADVVYNSNLMEITGPITYGAHYPNVQSGDSSALGTINEVGATDDITPLGAAQQVLFSVPFQATAFGLASFQLSPATLLPQHDVLEYGTNVPVPVNQVSYVGSSLTIGANFLSINNVSKNEGNSGTTPFVFTVTRGTPIGSTTVQYSVDPGTATPGVDYVAQSGTLTFGAGVTTQTITVAVKGDLQYENDETFFVNLSNPSAGATITTAQGDGTIVNDDPLPAISILGASGPDTSTLNFTVSLSEASGLPVTVQYATSDQTAKAGVDYTAANGTLTFAPGVSQLTIPVTTLAHLPSGTNETFLMTLSNPSLSTLATTSAIGTIVDPTAVNMSIDDVTTTQSTTTTLDSVFTVTLAAPTVTYVSVVYATADNTALAGTDYVATSGTLLFSPGVTSLTITVSVLPDTAVEPAETFSLNLTDPLGAKFTKSTGIGTLLNTEGLSIADTSVSASATATTTAIFTVTLPVAADHLVTVAYATADGTATAPTDYTATSGTLSFAAGVTSETITVPIAVNAAANGDATFMVNLTKPTGALVIRTPATGTIISAQPANLAEIRLEIVNPTTFAPITQLNVGDNFLLRAQVSDLRNVPQGVYAAYLDVLYSSSLVSITGPITYGTNYPNVHSGSTTTAGAIDEVGATDDQTPLGGGEKLLFSVPLTATSFGIANFTADPAELLPAHDVLEYGSNDPVPTSQVKYVSTTVPIGSNFLSINNVSQDEGNSGTTPFVFTVSRLLPSGGAATVAYSVAPGTATANVDYTPTSGTLTFGAGVTTQTLTVSVIGDTLNEADETFFVNLSNPTNAILGNAQGIGTILNDDAVPGISIAGATGNEGTALNFVVTLTPVSGQQVTVQYATGPSTTGAPATAGSDYTPVSGTLTFAPGVTTMTIPVQALSDAITEPDETFLMTLSNPVNATLTNSTALGTIKDVPPPSITGFVYVDTNNDGIKEPAEIGIQGVRITATQPNSSFVAITYTAADGSYSFPVLAPGTYNLTETQPGFFVDGKDTPGTPAPTGPVANDQFNGIVLAGDTKATGFDFGELGLRSQFVSDFLNRRAFLASSLNSSASGLPNSLSNIDLTKGDFWFSLDGGWQGLEQFDAFYTSSQGTVSMTLYDNNLNPVANGTVTSDRTDIKYFDTPGAAYFVKLSGTNPSVTFVVTDTVAINNVSVNEGNSGTTNAVFTLTTSSPLAQTATVAYATADGTATAGSDYVATSGTVTFLPGVTSQTITVVVNGDILNEANETFDVNLSNPTNLLVANQGIGTIVNDDPVPKMSITSVSLPEGNSGTTNFVFNVTLSSVSGQTVTVGYATADGTATAASGDYVATSGTATFAPGVTSQSITVAVNGDTLVEGNETFFVNLSGANAAQIINQGVGTIINDDSVTNSANLGSSSPAATSSGSSIRVLNSVGLPSANLSASTQANGPVTSSAATDQAISDSDEWLLSPLMT